MSPSTLFARHPRYTLALSLGVLATLLLLVSQRNGPSEPLHRFEASHGSTRSIRSKLEESESIYSTVLQGRKGLIQKFGPEPQNIDLFPPNVAPWPPYTVWDFFPASFQCPWEVERIGVLGDGGKWVCGLSRLATKRDCIVYSVGINGESSFEADLLSRTQHCQVWGYDYSVKEFGPQIETVPALKARSHFAPYYLSGEDKHGPDDNPPMWTLPSLMKANGHSWIDVLKIDIESWEFSTLTDLLRAYTDERDGSVRLPFGQLQLEIHAWNKKFPDFLEWWESLEDAGLRPFWTEPNLVYANYNRGGSPELAEYSFINIKGSHELLTDFPDQERLYEGAKAPRPKHWD